MAPIIVMVLLLLLGGAVSMQESKNCVPQIAKTNRMKSFINARRTFESGKNFEIF